MHGRVDLVRSNDVVIGSNKIYAAVHQFGATITPKSGQYLTFWMGGRLVKARSVTIPARPYLGISDDDSKIMMNEVGMLRNMIRK